MQGSIVWGGGKTETYGEGKDIAEEAIRMKSGGKRGGAVSKGRKLEIG